MVTGETYLGPLAIGRSASTCLLNKPFWAHVLK